MRRRTVSILAVVKSSLQRALRRPCGSAAPHLGQTLPVGFEVLLPDDLPAAFALLPQAFGAHRVRPRPPWGVCRPLGLSRLNQDMQVLTLSRVGMAPQGCKGAINLLREHGARQFVRKRHGRKRKQQIGALAPTRPEGRRGRR